MTELAERAVSVPIAARLLGISPRTAWKAVKAGRIPTIRYSRRVVVPLAALDEYLKTQALASTKTGKPAPAAQSSGARESAARDVVR